MTIHFTPGPSQIYPTMKNHLFQALEVDIPSLSHRSEKFKQLYKSVVNGLRELMNIPNDYQIFFLSSGTECMERVIESVVQTHSLHFVNGAFSSRFHKTSLDLGRKALGVTVAPGENFPFDRTTIPSKTELICLTHNETSTGFALNLKQVYQVKQHYPKTLVALDIVSSAPLIPINFELIDLAFFSVQKAFGLPAGLAVALVSPPAIEKAKYLLDNKLVSNNYHNFASLSSYSSQYETPETPNVLGIYLLDKIIQDFLRFGIQNLQAETQLKAQMLYDFFQNHKLYKPFIQNPQNRSKTVIVINTKSDTKQIIDHLKNSDILVGNGYGEFKDKQIRIANFPAHSIEDTERLLIHCS